MEQRKYHSLEKLEQALQLEFYLEKGISKRLSIYQIPVVILVVGVTKTWIQNEDKEVLGNVDENIPPEQENQKEQKRKALLPWCTSPDTL